MSWLYGHCVRPFLFQQDAEQVHNWAIRALGSLSKHPLACGTVESFFRAPSLPTTLFGLTFPNPVGLGAGMDKHANALPAWKALGFGFAELGAVTWHPQSGNPKPRVFRERQSQAIINRMGFNNPGAEAVAEQLARWRILGRWPNHPVAINLGKSKITPLEQAAQDYAASYRILLPHADFFVVNVSSPNTPNLRQLQDRSALDEILAAMSEVANTHSHPNNPSADTQAQAKPILVKVAPDLSFEAIDEIVNLALTRKLAGIVATNTTLSRPSTENPETKNVYAESGGLSGRPLAARSTEIIRHIFRVSRGKIPIIGVGGIFNEADAWEKITAGASLIQIYTGFVYEGPGLPRSIVKGLLSYLQKAGLTRIEQAVGLSATG